MAKKMNIKNILGIRDFVIGKLDRDESINAVIMAREFGISHRQAQRYMAVIIDHYRLDIEFVQKYKSYVLRNK